MATSQSTIDTIKQWYDSGLGRAADQGGLDYWSNQLSSGASQDDVFKAFQHGASVEKAASKPAASSGGGLIDSAPSSMSFVNYGGQQVRNDADYMSNLEQGAKMSGESAMEYDKRLNPETYGARWGIPVKSGSTAPTTGTPGASSSGPSLLNTGDLTQRTIDRPTETVAGQMNSLVDEDSPYIQQRRARAKRQWAGRGLINSGMAESAGEDAAIAAALQIAMPDAAAYGKAADYNTALLNQATMYNADTQNAFTQRQLDRNQQWSMAEMEDGTRRWLAERDSQEARYRADLDYRRTMDANRDSLVNNILMSGDSISPDRKAAMLEQLGMGTSAKRAADGTFIPGSGIAGAVYVIDDVANELRQATQQPFRETGGGSEGGDGGDGGGGGDGGDGGGGE